MTRFDLKDAQDASYASQRRWARRIGFAMVAFFAALSAVIVYLEIHSGDWFWPVFLLQAGLGLTIAVSTVMILVSRSSAEVVEVTEDHLTFQFSNGVVWRLAWMDPRFRLTLHKYSYFNGRVRNPPLLLADGPLGAGSLLTAPAYNEIVSAALAKGLSISEGRGSRFGPDVRSDVATRIRASLHP